MSIDVTANGSELELWHVQLGGGVRTMTLDELDQAFESGAIDEHTMVLKAGAIHWTTLGAIAGLETSDPHPHGARQESRLHSAPPRVVDDQPNSIAPLATDIASSNVVLPALPPPAFDVSFGTEELRVFRPKRRIGRALAAVATLALLAGAVFGGTTYGLEKLQVHVGAATAFVKSHTGESARAAAGAQPPPAAPTPAPPQAPTQPGQDTSAGEPAQQPGSTLPPEPTPVESLPSAKPAALGVSVDSLPSAPPEKAREKASRKHRSQREAAPKRKAAPAKAKSKASTDPTQRGSGQFDPLNGSL